MKILVIGNCNNLGCNISEYFYSDDIIKILDDMGSFSDRNEAENIISKYSPDTLIYLNTIEDIDLCEKDEETAYKFNVVCPLSLSLACKKNNIPIVYPSSAHIFNGMKSSPYNEEDECNPLNIYGKTKLYAEQLIKTICSKYYIVRTSLVFGTNVCILNEILHQKKLPVSICEKQIISPIYSEDFWTCIKMLVSLEKYGTYHLSGGEPVSKYDFINEIYIALNCRKEIMEVPINFIQNKAKRAEYTALDNSLIQKIAGIIIPPWKIRLDKYIKTSKM